jgi:putative flippase GtrA
MWRKIIEDQRTRFLLVGGANTLFCTGLFAGLVYIFGAAVPAVVSVFVAWLISAICVFFVYRRWVFRVHGSGRRDFARFISVNSTFLVFNLGMVALLVDVVGWPAIPVQIGLVCVAVVYGYIGHKYFSFRRKNSMHSEGEVEE